MLFTRTNRMTARFFAVIATVSLLASAFPASVFVAEAADTLTGPTDVTVDNTAEFATGAIDASGYENLELSFDYDAEALDGVGGSTGGTPDSFTYGWRDAGGDNDLGTVDGIPEPGSVGDETDSVSVSLPLAAQVADLEIYISVDANTAGSADEVVITNLTVEGDLPSCTPQYDVPGPTDIENSDTGEYFDSLQDAVDDCDTEAGDTITMLADITTSAQVTLDKAITFEGGDFTLTPAFAKTDTSNNAAIGIIGTDDVTVQNLVIDGTSGTDLHGINIYESEAIVIENVTINDINRTGIVVNGSVVDVTDFSSTGSGWHAINVAQGSGVTDPAELTINATSMHGETFPPTPHIFIDDTSQDVSVDDIDEQYDFVEFPLPTLSATALIAPPAARAYFLAPKPGLDITNPEEDGETLAGEHTFEALYVDEDEEEDLIRWAIRSDDCSVNEAGNVGGFSDPSDYATTTGVWMATVDMSTWENGDYCLVVNPDESGDGEDFREVRDFTLENKEPLTCEADINLVKNPSFEKPVVTAEKKWDILNLKKWKSEAVDDASSIDVEIQRGYGGWVSADGEQHVELDGEENTRIWQKIKTIPGEEYTLSWKYSARPDTVKPDSKMKVYVDGVHVKTNNRDGLDDVDWKTRTYTFVATKKKTEISFAGAGTSNSFGALIDDVSLMCNPVDPASLEITNPETDDEVLEGEYSFEALYLDDDDEEDPIRWAIRFETCEADDTATVAGNVGGFDDDFDFSSTTGEFSALVDMSAWDDGEYCFIVNPDEGGDDEDLRATRPFILDNPEPLVCEPGVNLLENPSFEEPAIDSAWALVSPVAWLVEKVIGGGSADMEIQRTVFGWSHSDGDQHTELAGAEADIIYQTVDTIPGETYVLSWDYSPRPGKSFAQNKMEVFVDGDEVDTNQVTGVGLSDTDWSSHEYVFEADGTSVEVAFADAGPSNGSGPLLDNTGLVCGDPEEKYYLVDGYKWDDYDGNGYWDEYEYGLEGWTIEITNGSTTYSTTTDMYGYYYFKVPAGEWEVSEVQQYGWEQTAPHYYDVVFAIVTDDEWEDDEKEDEYYPGTCEFLVGEEYEIYRGEGRVDEETDDYIYICDFGNHYIAEYIDGYKWNDSNGNGEWDEGEEGIEGWEIEVTNGTTTFSTTTDMYGYYSFAVEPGDWTVNEEARAGWTQTYPVDPNTCSFEVEHEHKKMKTLERIIDDEWEDDYYEYGYMCDFGNQYEGTTNSDASLICNIEADRTEIRSDSKVNLTWTSTGGSEVSINNGIGTTTDSGSQEVIVAGDTTYTLTVSNDKESIDCSVAIAVDGNSGGGGGESLTSSGPSGSVLGAATSTDGAPAQCGLYLNDYLRMGLDNDELEVTKLQMFLSQQGFTTPVTGLFGTATDASVRLFQAAHAGEVLTPWANLGLGDGSPTGYVFKTTKWKINDIVCPGIAAFPDLP